MTYNDWITELKFNLLGLSAEEEKRVLDYYAEAYADRRAAGYSETDIIAQFGAPYDAAQAILEGENSEKKSAPAQNTDFNIFDMADAGGNAYNANTGNNDPWNTGANGNAGNGTDTSYGFGNTGNVPPYPGGNQVPPYPGGNQVPPYPGGNQVPPYPGGNQVPPYPGGNQVPPYPGSNQVPPNSNSNTNSNNPQPTPQTSTDKSAAWTFVVLCLIFAGPLFALFMLLVGITFALAVMPFEMIIGGLISAISGIVITFDNVGVGLMGLGMGLIFIGLGIALINPCLFAVKWLWLKIQNLFVWLNGQFK